jgi:hypothetical protein
MIFSRWERDQPKHPYYNTGHFCCQVGGHIFLFRLRRDNEGYSTTKLDTCQAPIGRNFAFLRFDFEVGSPYSIKRCIYYVVGMSRGSETGFKL